MENQTGKPFWTKVKIFLVSVGPGLFLIGYNIGTGSVTTMAKSGAEYGMDLFWSLALAAIFTYVLMVAYGQVTLVTGKTSLNNIKHEFKTWGKPLAIYILIAVILGEILALMGIMGIVSELLDEALRLISGTSNSLMPQGLLNLAQDQTSSIPAIIRFALSRQTFWITFVLCIGLYYLLWYGRYPSFEKVLTFFVIQMGVCFIIVFVMMKPDIAAIVKGLVPKVPRSRVEFELIAAAAGTTCSAALFVMRSIVVAEKGWTINDLKNEKKDAAVSAIMMWFLSAIIMAVAAGTLYVMKLKLNNTVEMVKLFEPIGGKFAAFILILGVTGAGLSTVFPIVLIAPWLLCDYLNKPRDIRSPMFRALGFAGILFCFGMQFMKQQPPVLMVASQAFQACILPAVVLPIWILVNRKNVMGSHIAGAGTNIGIGLVFLYSLFTTYCAIASMPWDMIRSWFAG